jgi:TolA-binding protein
MAGRTDCPHNLSARARRGDLSTDERQQLERLLQGSPTLQTAHRVGLDFDQLAAVQPGDEQLVGRIVSRSLGSRAAKMRRPSISRQAVAWVAAGAILIPCATAFGLWHRFRSDASDPVGARLAAAGEDAGEAQRRAVRRPPTDRRKQEESAESKRDGLAAQTTPSASVAPDPECAPASGSREEPKEAVAPIPERPEQAATAAGLFTRANTARRAGRTSDAVALFARLQREFPRSAEAAHSHLSLGRLLLEQRSAQMALAHFAQYQGPLAEEALLGRAQALAALARFDDERAAWRELLERFPKSVYAARARARLGRHPDTAAR